MLSQGGGGGGEGHYGYMQEDGFSTLSLSFPCRWQPFGLGIVNLKTHSLRNQTGRTEEGGGGREKGEGTNVLTLSN